MCTGHMSSLTPTANIPASESYLGSCLSVRQLRRHAAPLGHARPDGALCSARPSRSGAGHPHARQCGPLVRRQCHARTAPRSARPHGQSLDLGRDAGSALLPAPRSQGRRTATDPRPGFPTVFYDPPAGRIVAHSDWTPNGTMFDYRASWISINHQVGGGGEFGLFRKGEWLTKEMSNYDGTANGADHRSSQHARPAELLRGLRRPHLARPRRPIWTNGSQWMLGENAGDPTTVMSTAPGYVYATATSPTSTTVPILWTASDAIDNITQATRSIVWLNNDYIVVYDRATTINGGLFKQLQPRAGRQPGNRRQYRHRNHARRPAALRPDAAAASAHPYQLQRRRPSATRWPTWKPRNTSSRSRIPPDPEDTRFLHVLQGADPAQPWPRPPTPSTGGAPVRWRCLRLIGRLLPRLHRRQLWRYNPQSATGIHTVLITGLTQHRLRRSGRQRLSQRCPKRQTMTDNAGVLLLSF